MFDQNPQLITEILWYWNLVFFMQKHSQDSQFLVRWRCVSYRGRHTQKIVFIDGKVVATLAYVLFESSTSFALHLKVDKAWRESCRFWEPATRRDMSIASCTSWSALDLATFSRVSLVLCLVMQCSHGIICNLFCCTDAGECLFTNVECSYISLL